MSKVTRPAPSAEPCLKTLVLALISAAETLMRAVDGRMTIDQGSGVEISMELLFARVRLEAIIAKIRESGLLDESN